MSLDNSGSVRVLVDLGLPLPWNTCTYLAARGTPSQFWTTQNPLHGGRRDPGRAAGRRLV